VKKVEDIHILVIGDIMLDKYVVGEVERISNEAPVPIVNVTNEFSTLGGCGNVVRNLREIGANAACLSSVGFDSDGSCILKHLEKLGVERHIVTASRRTTVKERVIADERKIQMLRLDRESTEIPDYNSIMKEFEKLYLPYDMVIISDYTKGMITKRLMEQINIMGPKFIVDPKPKNKTIYGHPYLITPNEKETKQMGGPNAILSRGAVYVLETRGREGMKLHHTEKTLAEIDADPVEVYNVSGAGDTVVAVMAVCLSLGISIINSAKIANKCAGYVVTQPETSVVPENIFMMNMVQYPRE
jgi:rfaE bifunctional protein kinase chain/domain